LPNRRAASIEASFEWMGWKWSLTYVSSEVCGERDLRVCGLKEFRPKLLLWLARGATQ